MIIAANQSALPYPAVDLLVDALPAGTATVTVRRSYDGATSVVRDANGAPTMGASSRPYTDAEVPLSVPVTYSAYAYSASGAQLSVAAAPPVTVTSAQAWITDPLAPGRATVVDLIDESLQSISRTTPGEISTVLDSALPIASMGTTQAGSFELRFRTVTAMISARTRLVLEYANPFLLRVPPEWNYDVPSLAYLAHTEYTVEKVSHINKERDHIAVAVTAVQPPPSPVVLQPRTYGDLRDEASTYGAIPKVGDDGLYPQYLGALWGR